MHAAVNETARLFNPLSSAIASGIVSLLNAMFDIFVEAPRREKTLKQIVYALKLEYPHESEEYITNLALNMLKDSK